MKFEDIAAALEEQRINARAADQLPNLFKSDDPVMVFLRENINLSRTAMGQGMERQSPLQIFRNCTGAAERPGIVQLFETTLASSVESSDQMTIDQADPFHQLDAIAREQIQPVLSSSISRIWEYMGPYLERNTFAFNSFPLNNIYCPTLATQESDPTFGEISTVGFTQLKEVFNCFSSDVALAFLRILANVMGRTFTYPIVEGDQSPEMLRAQAFASMRNKPLKSSIVNGFSSGVADTVNPLDILARKTLDAHGPDFFTPEMKEAMTEHHVNFAVLFAKFNLLSLASIEHTLRIPEETTITRTMLRWLPETYNARGKGHPANCDYYQRYFSASTVQKGGQLIPIVDFNFDEFNAEEIQDMQIGTVRFTCPSLGKPHAEFVQAMCRAYWEGVFPLVLDEYEFDF